MADNATDRPRFGVGTIVSHPSFGRGKVISYTEDSYVVIFKGGDVAQVPFTFARMTAEELVGDAETDRVKQAMREVMQDYGWLEVDLELGKKWSGGTFKMIPGKEGMAAKEMPIEAFFKKVVSVRDKLRVIEQKINAHKGLSGEEKIEMQGHITRCYGALTSFNVLFASKKSQFSGTGKG